jgi:hypothetical protein
MAIVLFILHSAFAFAINPIFLAKDFFSNLFVLQNGFDLKVYFPYAFGLTFAFAITAIMDLLQKSDKYFWTFAFSVATMELIGIALLVFPNHSPLWVAVSGFYYGFYLFLAIIFYFHVKPIKIDNAEIESVEQKIINSSVYERNINVYLYLIRLYNDNEEFLKIGITNYPENRYLEFKKVGYKIDEIFRWQYKNRTKVFDVERKCHNEFAFFKYTPLNKFGGFTECFSIDLLSKIDDINEFVQNCKNEISDKKLQIVTKREQNNAKVLQMISEGIPLQQIAKDLEIDLSTVYRIKKKNNV